MQPSERDEAVRQAVALCTDLGETCRLEKIGAPCWTELLRVAAAHPVVQARVLRAYGLRCGCLNQTVQSHFAVTTADAIASGAVTLDTEEK